MDRSRVKTRRKLNTDQLEVLELLRKFRFGSNDLFAQYFGKKDRSFVYKRLSILLEQGLIGKRFDASYRLQGRSAEYYLTPSGARELKSARGIETNIKNIYKDKAVSGQFVRRSMRLFAIYNKLRAEYGDELRFFTKIDMNCDEYDYFPRPLPEAYIRLKSGDKHFFLELLTEEQPHFVAKQKVRQYIEYDEQGDWMATDTDLPTLLVVCESSGLAKRFQKYLMRSRALAASEIKVAFTTQDELLDAEAAWRFLGESGVTLESIS